MYFFFKKKKVAKTGRIDHGSAAQNWATGPWFSRTKLGDRTMVQSRPDQTPGRARWEKQPIDAGRVGRGRSASLKVPAQTRNMRACGPMLYIIYT